MPPSRAAGAGTLLETIETIIGPASLFDLGFPRSKFARIAAMIGTQVLCLPCEQAEREFLLRFRQAGGHAPVFALDPSDGEFSWPPASLKNDDGLTLAYLEDAAATANFGERLLDAESCLLIPARADDAARSASAADGYRCVRLTDIDDGSSYDLLLPRRSTIDDADSPSTPAAGSVDAASFRSNNSSLVIEARAMVHDGGYVSEGDANYSWLWTGPSTHFRLVLPQIADGRPRRLELCVPRTEDSTNLDRLAVQLDGRPVAHRLERWSATSGKVVIEISSEHDDYAVVTLIAPKPSPDGNSSRVLGLCLDKMILTP